jgi:hypothetical protein
MAEEDRGTGIRTQHENTHQAKISSAISSKKCLNKEKTQKADHDATRGIIDEPANKPPHAHMMMLLLVLIAVASRSILAASNSTTYHGGSYGSRGTGRSAPQGTVLIATLDGRIYALDAWTGEQKWTFESGGPLISSSSSAVLSNEEDADEGSHENDLDEDVPVDCKVTPWLPWSRCSKQCSRGTQMRLRKIQQRARYGGMGCPPLSIVRSCNTRDCKEGESPLVDNEDQDSRSLSRRDDGVNNVLPALANAGDLVLT